MLPTKSNVCSERGANTAQSICSAALFVVKRIYLNRRTPLGAVSGMPYVQNGLNAEVGCDRARLLAEPDKQSLSKAHLQAKDSRLS